MFLVNDALILAYIGCNVYSHCFIHQNKRYGSERWQHIKGYDGNIILELVFSIIADILD